MNRVLSFDYDLPVSIEALNVDSFPAHYHEDLQIVYVLQGEIDIRLTYFSYHLTPGDMHFVHKNDIHSLTGKTDDNLVLLFNFNTDAFSSLYPDLHMQIFTTRVSKDFVTYESKMRLRDDMFSIIEEITEKKPGYQSKIYDLSKDMLRILYKDFRGFYIDTEKGLWIHTVSSDPMQTDRISRVTNYVYENYPYKISLNEIAESEHISKFYLSHLFHKHVGPSFRDFISLVRVEMSEHQLLNSDMPITRIAQECGFSHPKYYVEHFTNWFKYSPKEYRELFQEKTINHIEPKVEEIALEELLKYQDVMPIFESSLEKGESNYKTLKISVTEENTSILPWRNILELNVDDSILENVRIKEQYLKFYESILSKGIKIISTSQSEQDSDIDYYKYDHQNIAVYKMIDLINDIVNNKKTKWRADFIDTTDSKNGLYTSHGLNKPLYYLFMFLSEMHESIIKIGQNHIICKNEKDIKILLCNKSTSDMSHLDVMLQGLEGAYRLTELRLASDMCFSERWKQLDYKSDLTDKEKLILNGMSFPTGRFETIPDIKQFVYHCDMSPLEIIQLDLTKIK